MYFEVFEIVQRKEGTIVKMVYKNEAGKIIEAITWEIKEKLSAINIGDLFDIDKVNIDTKDS